MASPPIQMPGNDTRVSRACLPCRKRKTKCYFESSDESTNAICRRCAQLQLHCVFTESRRGGRRIKGVKGAPPSDRSVLPDTSMPCGTRDASRMFDRADGSQSNANREVEFPLQQAQEEPLRSTWGGDATGESTQDADESRQDSDGLEGHIASTDLLNPSDALGLLAQVADLDPGRQSSSSKQTGVKSRDAPGTRSVIAQSQPHFQPVADGVITWSQASYLVKRFHDRYHPFFPVAYSTIFDGKPISDWMEKEPYLLTAILTVASKDDPSWSQAHAACSRFMERLVTKLIYAGSDSIGSVEAVLILAEWAPQRLQENSAIGCGQEDHSAWMLIGIAIRLGYLQRLEQTALLPENESQSVDVSRKKVAWAACYMCDRQVSIRLGTGFWSRGPVPSISWRAADFPSLQTQALGSDSLALVFQAQLELIQLFSNAHSILYSSSTHRKQLYLGGEYIRYIDDFADALRKWKMQWANCTFTPSVKASLVLSFEFLRLYINAFAFQAALNRKVARASSQPSNNGPAVGTLFSQVASDPDARFIYESVDAANSLLSVSNGFVDPIIGLKCMPLKYCLYVIYAAVFLFKVTSLPHFTDLASDNINVRQARLAGAIDADGDGGVRRAIQGTIAQLQKTSDNPHSLGPRYATSLRLLWRKLSGKRETRMRPRREASRQARPSARGDASTSNNVTGSTDVGFDRAVNLDPLNGFSWRDLDSLGQYIADSSSLSMTDGMLANPDFDWEHSSAGFDDPIAQPPFDGFWPDHDVVF